MNAKPSSNLRIIPWPRLLALGLALLLAALLLAGLSFTQGRMNRLRQEHGLTETAPLENAPPLVAFTTVALGGFRGLLADALWLRSTRLQDEGSYFEMFQLASWIVKLQPRFTGATAFLAWNMAYNISVTCNDFNDRWRWIQRGIELIRDEALLYNPTDPELYKELSWIYLHKLGQDMDDANRHYKLQFAKLMTAAAGPAPVDWDALNRAPRTPAAFRAALGDTAQLWPLLAAQKLTLDDLESRFRTGQGKLPPELDRELPAAERAPLLTWLRARWLREGLRLEPRRIAELNRRYGALDWRLPQAHGLYWAEAGLDHAPERQHLGCERLVFQGLSQAFKSGRLLLPDPASDLFDTTPNLELLPTVTQAYRDSIAKHPANQSVRAGYENFLIDATVTLYTFGRTRQALDYLQRLRQEFSGNAKYRQPLDEFALGQLAEDVASASRAQAQGTIQGYLVQSCYWLALGDEERSAAFEMIAGRIWQKYMKQIGPGTMERRGLAPLPEMKRYVIGGCLQQFPPALAERLRATLGPAAAAAPPSVPSVPSVP